MKTTTTEIDIRQIMTDAALSRIAGTTEVDTVSVHGWSDAEHDAMIERLIGVALEHDLDCSINVDASMTNDDLMLEIGYGLCTAASDWLVEHGDLGDDEYLARFYA